MSAALRWLTATTLGLVIGGFALHFPGRHRHPRLGDPYYRRPSDLARD